MHPDLNDDEGLLTFEDDWNLLRGRTTPEEVFFIVKDHTGRALVRLQCHGFKRKPAGKGQGDHIFWETTLSEVLYKEPGLNVVWGNKAEVNRDDCFPTLEAAAIKLNELREQERARLKKREQELKATIGNLQHEIEDINKTIKGWPELPLAEEGLRQLREKQESEEDGLIDTAFSDLLDLL